MSPEMARSHEAVPGLMTRVCDEPVFLHPPRHGNFPNHLSAATAATCRAHQKRKRHVAFGFGGFSLLAFGGRAALNTQASMTACYEKNPQQLVLVAASLWTFILGWTMKTVKALQGNVAAEETSSGKSFPDMDLQILGNVLPQKNHSLANELGTIFSFPLHQFLIKWEQFQEQTKQKAQ